MRIITASLAILLLAPLAGCMHRPPVRQDDGLDWAQAPAPEPTQGSIYRDGQGLVLFENPIAHRVGDIVTIVLNETNQAQKSSSTNTSKQTTDTLPGMTLLGKALTVHGVPIMSNNIADQTQFKGAGDSAQSDSLTGYITVTVARVLPNGNLYVRGGKDITINQGSEQIVLSGVIRPIDLSANNSIPSYMVADAKISYGGRGALADANAQGWLSRFFNSPWTPF